MVPLAIWPVPKSITCLTKINPATNENKFWAVGFERVPMSSSLALRRWWGRIDTAGQTDTVGPFSEEQCLERARELVAAKLREGYRRQDGIDFAAPFMRGALLALPPPAFRRWPQEPTEAEIEAEIEQEPTEAEIERPRVVRVRPGRYESMVEERSAKQRERALVILSSERVIDFED